MKNYPVIKFTIPFIIGIILQRFFLVDPIIYIFSLLLFLILFLFSLKVRSNLFAQVKSLLLYMLIFLCGIYTAELNGLQSNYLPQNIYRIKDASVFGKIIKIELPRKDEIIFELSTDSLNSVDYKITGEIKLICKVRDESKRRLDSLNQTLAPGNYVQLKGTYFKGRERRNTGEFDYNYYLNSLGVSGILIIYNARDIAKINDDVNTIQNIIFKVRKNADKVITRMHDSRTASLIKGLLLADRSDLDYETKVDFINTGVIHVLSVSGLHVGYIVLIFLILFGRFNIYIRSILSVFGLIGFMLITGIQPAVFRATIMGIVFILTFISNRTTNLYNALALAALVILIFQPYELFDPGFQLSFSAILAMAALIPFFRKIIYSLKLKSKALNYLLLFSAVSLSAQIGTMPFTLIYFSKLSLIALAANLIVIPLTGIIIGVSIFTILLNFISPWLAGFYAVANNLFTYFLFLFVNSASSFEYSFLWVRNFSIQDAILFYLFFILLIYFFRKFNSIAAKTALVIIIFSNIFIYAGLDDKNLFSKGELNILMIDVGQGDAILLKFPNGQTALIDAGDASFNFDNGERIIHPLLNYLDINTIDYAFVSNIDSDHYGGFISLIENDIIKKIVKPPRDSLLKKGIKFEKLLKERRIPIQYYNKNFFDIGNVRLYTLNDYQNKFYSKLSTNDKSGILKIVYGKTSFLFPGDIEKKAEEFYCRNYVSFIDVDVLKVAHHGSITSSIDPFVSLSTPKISLISVGSFNKFKHPSLDVIRRLNKAGSKIFRTDEEGAILLRSNGNSVYKVNWR